MSLGPAPRSGRDGDEVGYEDGDEDDDNDDDNEEDEDEDENEDDDEDEDEDKDEDEDEKCCKNNVTFCHNMAQRKRCVLFCPW